ncbi:MAG: hypothetical protein EOO77_41800 [Oxalobacteraceae bacterium]|nr:MAG: hypothetical protein EOO77_41800 [Oxalobacteraceae bacterium]
MTAGRMQPGDGRWWHLVHISGGFGLDAVAIFFVVSGFWIGKSVTDRIRRDRFAWGGYTADRLTRMWIVLIPALLVGLICDTAYLHIVQGSVHLPEHYPAPAALHERLDASHFLASMFFLQETLLPPFGSNGPLWSLAYEGFYYL